MLITSGGVSAGDYDMVKDVLASEGEITFWTVRMKPGKPLAFGTIKGIDKRGNAKRIPHLGFPGNPVSSMVTFELFARPAMLKMMGKKNLAKPVVEAVLEEPAANTDGRRCYIRAIVTKRDGQYYARLTGPQGSGILTSMSLANGLVIVPEDTAGVKAGEIVKVIMLGWDDEDNI
jgi:molybdopterin molybdotransferase